MKRSRRRSRCCPNPDCFLRGQASKGNIIRHSFYITSQGRRRRYRCKECGRTFSSTHSTPYYRSKSVKSGIEYTVSSTPLLTRLRFPAAQPCPLSAPPRSSTMILRPYPCGWLFRLPSRVRYSSASRGRARSSTEQVNERWKVFKTCRGPAADAGPAWFGSSRSLCDQV